MDSPQCLMEIDVIPTMQARLRPQMSWQSPCPSKAGCSGLRPGCILDRFLEIRKPLGFFYTAYWCLQALAIGWGDSSLLGAPGARLILKSWWHRAGAASAPTLQLSVVFPKGGLFAGLMPELTLEKTREIDWYPRSLPRVIDIQSAATIEKVLNSLSLTSFSHSCCLSVWLASQVDGSSFRRS